MSNKQSTETKKGLENIGDAIASSENFLERNKKFLIFGILAVILIVGGVLAYQHLYNVPRNERAQEAMFRGERYFQNGQDEIALFGNNNNFIGFEAIITEFRGTRAANLARAYAGIAHARLGNHEQALTHLKAFRGRDLLIAPAVTGAVGDVYMNMGEIERAIPYFMRAAQQANNDMLSPIFFQKAGLAYLQLNNFDRAIEIFERIQRDHINSPEAMDADKFIQQARIQRGR